MFYSFTYIYKLAPISQPWTQHWIRTQQFVLVGRLQDDFLQVCYSNMYCQGATLATHAAGKEYSVGLCKGYMTLPIHCTCAYTETVDQARRHSIPQVRQGSVRFNLREEEPPPPLFPSCCTYSMYFVVVFSQSFSS